MIISKKISKISPIKSLKGRFYWKPLFVKFGKNLDDTHNYFSSRQDPEISLVLMYCSINNLNKQQLIDFVSVYFISSKYVNFIEKIFIYDLNEIYIGGIQYTDCDFIQKSGWIKQKRA